MESENGSKHRPISRFSDLLLHLTWIALGPIGLVAVSMVIVSSNPPRLSALNGIYFLILAIMVFARWFGIHLGAGVTSTGAPANWTHFRRYTFVLVPAAVLLWLAVNYLGK
ncbi:MAG: hypothetical protein HY537_04860 [Deltaproteobacteria bacterium]|nr:hypothetical protein [Deltaproteobacteria bacterium]